MQRGPFNPVAPRRRPLLDEKVAGEGEMQSRLKVLGQFDDNNRQPPWFAPVPPAARKEPDPYPAPSDRVRRHRSPERRMMGPQRGRRSSTVADSDHMLSHAMQPPHNALQYENKFGSVVLAHEHGRAGMSPPELARGGQKLPPATMAMAGMQPKFGFPRNDPYQDANDVTAMELENPPRYVRCAPRGMVRTPPRACSASADCSCTRALQAPRRLGRR